MLKLPSYDNIMLASVTVVATVYRIASNGKRSHHQQVTQWKFYPSSPTISFAELYNNLTGRKRSALTASSAEFYQIPTSPSTISPLGRVYFCQSWEWLKGIWSKDKLYAGVLVHQNLTWFGMFATWWRLARRSSKNPKWKLWKHLFHLISYWRNKQ